MLSPCRNLNLLLHILLPMFTLVFMALESFFYTLGRPWSVDSLDGWCNEKTPNRKKIGTPFFLFWPPVYFLVSARPTGQIWHVINLPSRQSTDHGLKVMSQEKWATLIFTLWQECSQLPILDTVIFHSTKNQKKHISMNCKWVSIYIFKEKSLKHWGLTQIWLLARYHLNHWMGT